MPEREILPGLQLLGKVEDKFVSILPLYAPTADGSTDDILCVPTFAHSGHPLTCSITKSYDATSHFETVVGESQTLGRG